MKGPLRTKSYLFAIEIIKLSQELSLKREFILSRQILRSGTAIGASLQESVFAVSKADFSNKLSISLKEANETIYWLNLLYDTGYISLEKFKSLETVCTELIAMLIAAIKKINSKIT